MSIFDLTKSGGMKQILGSGWSTPEATLVWNDGYYSSLNVPIDRRDHEVKLALLLDPYVNGSNSPMQRVEIYCWGLALGFFTLRKREMTTLEVRVPPYVTNFGALKIDIKWPDAKSPVAAGGVDKRVLAGALHQVAVS